ncbi:hypothetical protein B4098_1213 [Heyndrickxia coagulans]|uniref:Uncharacterized protein n=1 Tax=Heyndrickxia coagulans TaxID=1398 RepID=A0A150KCG9_HEYCO|nr:hypothetical protein B4098_1213 [Heyndrickxia coagulans]
MQRIIHYRRHTAGLTGAGPWFLSLSKNILNKFVFLFQFIFYNTIR